MEVTEGTKNKGDYGYFEQNITIHEELYPLEAYFSIDYYYSWWKKPDNCSLFMAAIMEGVNRNKTLNLRDIANHKEWFTMNLEYNPVTYGQVLPGVVTIRVGVITNELSTSFSADLRLDNIEYKLWTKPNQTGIIKAYDNEFAQNHTYYNITFGKGYSFIDAERTRALGEDIVFTIYSNISNIIDFTIDEITIISYVVKEFNSTVSNKLGSLYTPGENINWLVEFSIFIPPYYNSWIEIDKPGDWSFFHIMDGFEEDKTEDCLGTGSGSTKLIIPNSILGPGLWKLEAISKNYITKGNIAVWKDSQFENISKLVFGDIFEVNITLNASIILSNTIINCTIYYPNSTVFWQDIKEPTSHNIKFGNFIVGNNMTVGKYLVTVLWTNNQSCLNRDQIGYIELEFIIWHYTNLTAINSYFEMVAGDPLLLKVKFVDSDLNEIVDFASISYNSTFGASGTMSYQGSGIYVVDVDIDSLGLGDYYFSFNASKEYYENQSIKNLIHLKIIAQPLKLDTPHTVIEATANSYISCQVNVTGALSGTLIWPVNISSDWQNPYSAIDHDNGTYTLNFSTWGLPSQGIIETYTIYVFANKTHHGNTQGYITLTIYPIQTVINVNKSIINVDLNEIVDVYINYTVDQTGLLIQGAECSVVWSSFYNILPKVDGFIVRLSTINLSIDTYIAIIKLVKSGFETAYKSITVIINQIEIEVNTINFQNTLEVFIGDEVNIKLNLTELGTDIFIENATIFFFWEFGVGYFNYIGNGTYQLELKLPPNVKGNHKMTLIISKEDSTYKSQEFSFIVSINEKEQPNTIFWIFIIGLLIVISILGILSLRSYVILPAKRKKISKLLVRTQRYKDIMNIEAIVISQRPSGITLYTKSYYFLEKDKKDLISGFVHAITTVGKNIVRKEILEQQPAEMEEPYDIEKLIELDFKHFYFLICDYKELRVVFILKEKASERFKEQTQKLLQAFDLHFSKTLENWDGSLEKFDKLIPPIISNYFELYFKEQFTLNKSKYIANVRKEAEFHPIESRVLNVIYSMSIVDEKLYLKDIVEAVDEKNKNLVIDALESLIEKRIIIPSFFSKTGFTI